MDDAGPFIGLLAEALYIPDPAAAAGVVLCQGEDALLLLDCVVIGSGAKVEDK